MPAYKPGQGLNSEALARLKARKTAAGGIADVPAADSNSQWTRVLGGSDGGQKKLRCGICTKPLGEQEQAEKKLVCGGCEKLHEEKAIREAIDKLRAPLDSVEIGFAIYYQYLSKGPLPAAAPAESSSGSRSRSRGGKGAKALAALAE
eukprot:TRINITY_DN58045_c0_g1_i1.p1 TRINITY_DN58045_c0_g1~~TRINITY_DN58045_c0_g1_i1.p1  ORF type:complete len:148 (-),score=45.04 TRINITY_DN58045_c0_g1_i1:674-1117(-)